MSGSTTPPPLPPSSSGAPQNPLTDPEHIFSDTFPQSPPADSSDLHDYVSRPQRPEDITQRPPPPGEGPPSDGGRPPPIDQRPPDVPSSTDVPHAPGDSSVDIGRPGRTSTLTDGMSSSDVIFIHGPDSPGPSSSSGDLGGGRPSGPDLAPPHLGFRPDAPLTPTAPTGHADIDATVSPGPHGGGSTLGKIVKVGGGLLDFVQVVDGAYRDGAELLTGQPNEGFVNPAIQGTQVGNVLNNVAQATPITTGALQTIEQHAGHTVAAGVGVVASPVQIGELTFNGGVKVGVRIADEIGYTDRFVNGLEKLGVVDAVVEVSDFTDNVADLFGLGGTRAPTTGAAAPAGSPGLLVSAFAVADVVPPAPPGGGVVVDEVW